jgi:hypothetical protein
MPACRTLGGKRSSFQMADGARFYYQLAQAGSQERSGFETAITVNTAGPYFAVTAHDTGGRLLAQSATARRTSG